MPWALTLALQCGHIHYAPDGSPFYVLDRFPRPGGWHDQDDYEMSAIRIATRALLIAGKQQAHREWSMEDAEFMAWMDGAE